MRYRNPQVETAASPFHPAALGSYCIRRTLAASRQRSIPNAHCTSGNSSALEGCIAVSSAYTDSAEGFAEVSVIMLFDSAKSASASVDRIERELEKVG